MNVLICGANGFVGRHLVQSLGKAGHNVIRGVRRPQASIDIAIDYRTDTHKEAWRRRLADIDVVINAVGVLRTSVREPMQQLHGEAPRALFESCAEAGVPRVVHFSALGIDQGIETLYFQTRRIAEASLHKLSASIRWLVMRPSIIYGEDGASARLFRKLAKLPLHALPMGGHQVLQPVHIHDICEATKRWLRTDGDLNQVVAAVGAEATTMRGMLDSYRSQMGLPRALHIDIPATLIRITARLGDVVPSSPLCTDTLRMLLAGNTADATGFAKLLGRSPLSYRHFIEHAHDAI